MADVFISYSKSDRSYALDLAEELRTRGISVWIDQTSIHGAKNWSGEIVEAIDACSTVLCLLSAHSIASHNVAKEIHLASEKQKTILPVLIEKVTLPPKLEYPLAGLQHVFYKDRPAIFEALGALGAVTSPDLPSTEVDDVDTIRIAVLPFDDLSPQHDNQWFADGMMDELISTLGGLENMKVPPRSDVLSYRGHTKKSRDIAREVGVRYLIEGGVRKAKEKIRINASLTDTLRGEQLWTNKFDGTFEDVFEFQESVSRQIVESLKLTLTYEEKQKMEERGTTNAKAYELYLKGRHEQFYASRESYKCALDYYNQAVQLDPKFERAYIGVASISCVYYREYSKNPAWLRRAEENLVKAEAAAGATSRTVYVRGLIEWLSGNGQAAIASLTRATELDPKNSSAFNVLGTIYMEHGNSSGAIEAYERAVRYTETTADYFNLLMALSAAEQLERLEKTAAAALPVFDRYLQREPQDQNAAISRAYVLLFAGKNGLAREAADALMRSGSLSGRVLYNLGSLYHELGEPQLYITSLREAIARGYREIENTRSHQFRASESAFESEFRSLVAEMEALIATESAEIAS